MRAVGAAVAVALTLAGCDRAPGAARAPEPHACGGECMAPRRPPEPERLLDLSHVKAGQRFVYRLTQAGLGGEQTYVVEDVGPNRVTYRVITRLDLSDGPVEVGEAAPQEWSFSHPLPPSSPPGQATTERMLVGGHLLEVRRVDDRGDVWIPVRDGMATFPPVLRRDDGRERFELVEVHEP